MGNTPSHDTCIICTDTYAYGDLCDVNGRKICHDCLRAWFETALTDEGQYPLRMGGAIVHLRDYREIFEPEFVAAFEAREREYNTPLYYRLYCCPRPGGRGCERFLGNSTDFGTRAPLPVRCPACEAETCICKKPYEDARSHDCTTESVLPTEEKGTTWQQCPNRTCRAEVSRIDGCNEMRCLVCKMRYCHHCGQQVAEADDLHWAERCPRFPASGTGAPQYDEVIEEGDEDDADDEDDDFEREADEAFMTDDESERIVAALQLIGATADGFDALLQAQRTAHNDWIGATARTYGTNESLPSVPPHIAALARVRHDAVARLAAARQTILRAGDELRRLPYGRDRYNTVTQQVFQLTGVQLNDFDDSSVEDNDEQEEDASDRDGDGRIDHAHQRVSIAVEAWFGIRDAYNSILDELRNLEAPAYPGAPDEAAINTQYDDLRRRRNQELNRRDEVRQVILDVSDELRHITVDRDNYVRLQQAVLADTGIMIHDFSDSEPDSGMGGVPLEPAGEEYDSSLDAEWWTDEETAAPGNVQHHQGSGDMDDDAMEL